MRATAAAPRDVRRPRPSGWSRGVTLVELMLTAAIITIGIVGGVLAFKYVGVAVQGSRGRTVAAELAQEKIENLKDISYYNLLVTTATATDNNPAPPAVYDTSNYPPETIVIGNRPYLRYTFVALAQVFQNNISTVSYTYPDTGMKQIQVYIVWNENNAWKEFSLTNLLENPNVNPLDTSVSGRIVQLNNWNGGSNPVLPGAHVYAEQNAGYQAISDANGNFSFRVYHGSYTIHVSSAGFFEFTSNTVSASAGVNSPMGDLVLQQVATGTVSGTVWLNPHPVISQVVLDSYTYCEDGAKHDVEYIELFNPTVAPVNIGNGNARNLYLTYNLEGNSSLSAPTISDCTSGSGCWNWAYVSTYVAPGHYFLYSNCQSFWINGSSVAADAYESPPHANHQMSAGSAGTLILAPGNPTGCASVAQGSFCDVVGWNNPATSVGPPFNSAPQYTTSFSPGSWGNAISSGIPTGTQAVRVSSPGASVTDIARLGRAYNSQNNMDDFVFPTYNGVVGIATSTFYSPFNTAADGVYSLMSNAPASSFTVVSGMVPYSGNTQGSGVSRVYVFTNDANSGSATSAYLCASSGTVGAANGTWWSPTNPNVFTSGCYGLPYARFNLPVATSPAAGWTADIAYVYDPYTAYLTQITSVTVAQNAATNIPNPTTISSAALPVTFLAATTVNGFVAGVVQDASGNPLGTPGQRMLIGGVGETTGSNGMFFAMVSSGSISVIANSNSAPPYVQNIQSNVVIQTGRLNSLGVIQLSQGGGISGYVTSGTTPLPGVVMTANLGGSQLGAATTGTGGNFTIPNLAVGTYTISPVLPPSQTSSPASAVAAAGAGTTAFSATFTITGYLGTLTGNVVMNGNAVTSGALILASDVHGGILPNPPTPIYASTAPAMAYPVFAASSRADGTYSLPLAGGTSYYVSVYIPAVNGSQVVVSTKVYGNVFIAPGANTQWNITYP